MFLIFLFLISNRFFFSFTIVYKTSVKRPKLDYFCKAEDAVGYLANAADLGRKIRREEMAIRTEDQRIKYDHLELEDPSGQGILSRKTANVEPPAPELCTNKAWCRPQTHWDQDLLMTNSLTTGPTFSKDSERKTC